MRLKKYGAEDFAGAFKALLPPGAAWDWPQDGLGAQLLLGTAQELARVDAQAQPLLDAAVRLHQPRRQRWLLSDYQAVANNSQTAQTENGLRPGFAAGSAAGTRLWSGAGASFAVPVQSVRACQPFSVGSGAGGRLWGAAARYILQVRYYASVADVRSLVGDLLGFRQSHMFLWVEDITGSGGFIDAQD